MRRSLSSQIPLWMTVILGIGLVITLGIWTHHSSSDRVEDGREVIVFWGAAWAQEEIFTVLQQFEQRHPQYKILYGNAVARDLTGDAQRLLCAVAGGVPPDLLWFARFAIGEWAGRDALTNLTPYLQEQEPHEPYRIDPGQFYPFALEEASYAPVGTDQKAKVYGIPTTVDIRLLYSNADLLRQEGLVDAKGEPRPARNWQELRDYANRLTRYNRPNDQGSGIARLGFAPNFGNSWLYMFAWQAGGEFLTPDRRRVTLDSQPVVRSLRWMTNVYDDLGGFKQVDAFRTSFQNNALDPFLRGQVATKIDGDWYLTTIADYKRDLDFIMTPAPMPQDQLDKGRHPITWSGGWSLVIPKTARNKRGAWKLIQYLNSREAMMLMEQGKRERKESEGRLYLPEICANRVIYEELIRDYVDANPRVPPRIKQAYGVMKQMVHHTLIRPVTPVGQLLWDRHVFAYEHAVNHQYAQEASRSGQDEIKLCLTRAQEPVQKMLDEVLTPLPADSKVNWGPYFWAYGAIVAGGLAGMLGVYHARKRRQGYTAREVGAAMLFVSPWAIGFLLFIGGPILFSIVFSFTRYDVLSPAHYVGLENFRQILRDDLFYRSLMNTLFMIIRIPLVMALSLGIAMLLDRAIRGIGFYRTVFYLPAIMPVVASSLLWLWILNPNQGVLNPLLNWIFDTGPVNALEGLISRFTAEPLRLQAPLWLQDPNWAKPGLIIMNLWSAGGGMIVWLAGLQSIPPQLYEAAAIDGAGAWRRFRHVTLPMLSPYILFNIIIGLISTMQIFGEAFIMTEGGPSNATLFYAYHLFKEAFQFFRMGKASALAWILFIMVLLLTLLQLWLSRKWVHYDRS